MELPNPIIKKIIGFCNIRDCKNIALCSKSMMKLIWEDENFLFDYHTQDVSLFIMNHSSDNISIHKFMCLKFDYYCDHTEYTILNILNLFARVGNEEIIKILISFYEIDEQRIYDSIVLALSNSNNFKLFHKYFPKATYKYYDSVRLNISLVKNKSFFDYVMFKTNLSNVKKIWFYTLYTDGEYFIDLHPDRKKEFLNSLTPYGEGWQFILFLGYLDIDTIDEILKKYNIQLYKNYMWILVNACRRKNLNILKFLINRFELKDPRYIDYLALFCYRTQNFILFDFFKDKISDISKINYAFEHNKQAFHFFCKDNNSYLQNVIDLCNKDKNLIKFVNFIINESHINY